jgi:hypothetical protein
MSKIERILNWIITIATALAVAVKALGGLSI